MRFHCSVVKSMTIKTMPVAMKAVHIDEMPHSGKANGMAVARRANERRDVTRIIFRGPDAVAWNLQGRKPNPFAPRCAAVIEIETRVVHQDRKPAANQDHHKKKIEEVAVAYPYGKAVRPREIVWIYLGNSRNRRHSRYCDLDPGRRNQRQNRDKRRRSGLMAESRCEIGDQADSEQLGVLHRMRS